jgi:restriction endonuclease S subunit
MSCTIAEVKRQLESVTEKIQNIHNLLDSCKELKKHRFTVKLVKSDDAFNSKSKSRSLRTASLRVGGKRRKTNRKKID